MTWLEDKVIDISGAASGIGLATAHLLAARGATLTVSDVRSDALATATKSIQQATTLPTVKALMIGMKPSSSTPVSWWCS